MKAHCTRVSVVMAWVGALVCAAAHGTTVELKEDVYVKGPKLYLGDLAKIGGKDLEALASLEMGAAAAAGSTKRLSASIVRARIRRAGFPEEQVPVTGSDTVRATTLHMELPRDVIAEDLRRYIQAEMPWDPADTILQVDPPYKDIILPEGDLSIAWRSNPRYKYAGQGAFRGQLLVDGKPQRVVYLNASIEAYTEVVVAAQDINRGSALSPKDLVVEKRLVTTLPTGSFASLDMLVGQEAKTTMVTGQVLTRRRVIPRRVVRRNQIVTVTVDIGSMHIRTRAKALSDGSLGEEITCRNIENKSEFVGVVSAPGSVVIQ